MFRQTPFNVEPLPAPPTSPPSNSPAYHPQPPSDRPRSHRTTTGLFPRTSVVNTGSAFSTSRFTLWTYNDRNELLTSKRYNGTNINTTNDPVSAQHYTYAFDPIGNRTAYTGDSAEGAQSYVTNELNQYVSTSQPSETLDYDLDGNMTEDNTSTFVWNAENRLIEVTPKNPNAGSRKLKFAYDWRGRRIQKRIYSYNTGTSSWNTTPLKDLRFLYDRWNLIMTIDAAFSPARVVSQFTWGLDLSGLNGNSIGTVDGNLPGLHGAGGIGGLLATRDLKSTTSTSDDKSGIYFYDANGNVVQVWDATLSGDTSQYGTICWRYEYYPFGGRLVASRTSVIENPFQYSTKYRDDESALLYYSERYHKPRHGRWISRDPIGERGGASLYVMVANTPTSLFDPIGLSPPTLGAAPEFRGPFDKIPLYDVHNQNNSIRCRSWWVSEHPFHIQNVDWKTTKHIEDPGYEAIRHDYSDPFPTPPPWIDEYEGIAWIDIKIDGSICCQCDYSIGPFSGRASWTRTFNGTIRIEVPFRLTTHPAAHLATLIVPLPTKLKGVYVGFRAVNVARNLDSIAESLLGGSELLDRYSRWAACISIPLGLNDLAATVRLPMKRINDWSVLIGFNPYE